MRVILFFYNISGETNNMRPLSTYEIKMVSGSSFSDYIVYIASTVSNLVVGGSGATLGAIICNRNFNFSASTTIAGSIMGYNIARGIQEWYHALYNANNPVAPAK